MLSLLGVGIDAAYHVVYALAAALAPVAGGLATALAIVVFTAAVRLLLSPLSFWALRGQARMSALLPKMQELQRRFARQPDRLQAELGALYRSEGSGLVAGCLPLLLQLPFFSVMYRLFRSSTVNGRPNVLLSRDLLGTPLRSHWLAGAGPVSSQGMVFGGLFVLLAAAAWLAARSARRAGAAAGTGQPAGAAGALGRLLPYATVVIAALVPLAAGIYLVTTTVWSVAERRLLRQRVVPPGSGDTFMRIAPNSVPRSRP